MDKIYNGSFSIFHELIYNTTMRELKTVSAFRKLITF